MDSWIDSNCRNICINPRRMYLVVEGNTLSMKRLYDLPRENFMKIMMDLSYSDVKAVSKTCRRLTSICESILECKRKVVEISEVWRNHYQPPAANILSAASLARQGFLNEVKFIHLGSYQDEIFDISSIPLLSRSREAVKMCQRWRQYRVWLYLCWLISSSHQHQLWLVALCL